MKYLLCIVIGYLLGCINPAYFIGKMKGEDIRDSGSKNPGASNATILYGWKYGVFTALFDIFKAFASVKIAEYICPDDEMIKMVAGSMAVMGHMFPFYMGFKGGKGYSSLTGMVLGLNWKLALIMIVAGILITIISNYIVMSTLVATVVYPVYFFYVKAPLYGCLAILVVCLTIVYKHRMNIRRILNGTEFKFRDVNKHRKA